MVAPEIETCWMLIRGAAEGRLGEREEFARRYLPTVRAYLAARWSGSPLAADIEDVVQEVFLACFREGGVLQRANEDHGGSFRGLIYRVTQNLALHAERTRMRRRRRVSDGPFEVDWVPASEATLSRVFDRHYAQAILRDARRIMEQRAAMQDDASRRRVELLRLRFEEGLPIREIAARWNEEPARLHREYAKASREFKVALAEAVTAAEGCHAAELQQHCDKLLQLLRA